MPDSYMPGATAQDSGHGGLQIIITAGPARFIADEPKDLGGLDLGPTPHDLVCAGLAACTSQTLRLYANRKQWPLGEVEVQVTHDRKADQKPADIFTRTITLRGALDDDQRQRLVEIAERCPVHLMLTHSSSVETVLTNAL